MYPVVLPDAAQVWVLVAGARWGTDCPCPVGEERGTGTPSASRKGHEERVVADRAASKKGAEPWEGTMYLEGPTGRTVHLAGVWVVVGLVGAWCSTATASECDEDWPNHPEWVFCHDFEAADATDWSKYWNNSAPPDPEKLFLVEEVVPGIAGRRILRIELVNDTDQDLDHSLGAGLGKWFGETVEWEDFYYRKYIRFNEDFYQGDFMHLGRLRACAPSIYPWECLGGAGHRPAGDTKYTTGVEPWIDYGRLEPPGRWGFYTYFHLMSQDCGFPGPDDCYGDMYAPDPPVLATRGVWHVVEFMIHPNRPGQDDGYQRFWIDGQPVYTSPPMDWRTVEDLRVNEASLGVYIHYPPAHTDNIVDYDNVVFSTSYIGPARCQDGVAIGAPCLCGGDPDPEDGSNVYTSGYCCGGTWQEGPCGAAGDGGPRDAQVQEDGGLLVDGASEHQADGGEGEAVQDEGCGCRTHEASPWWWFLLPISLWHLRRRRVGPRRRLGQ